MPRKDKAGRAAYMRDYRARRPLDTPIARSIAESHGIAVEDVPAYLHGKPPFLVAPVDTCPLCAHDRQEADHLGGRPCKFRNGRRACGCVFEGF